MKDYKNVGLSKQPSLIIREKQRRKPWENKAETVNLSLYKSQKGLARQKENDNGKNGTYD